MSETMLAALPDGHGHLQVDEIPRPEPAAGEALVAIARAGMNRADLLHARGRYTQRLRRPGDPDVAGLELAGHVVQVGPAGDPSLVGQRVMAMWPGAYAEFASIPVELLLPVPEELTWREAAGLPMALLTEYEALARLAKAAPASRAVVTGATSAVGLVGVQLARELGLRSIATTRDPHNDDLLLSLGADAVAHGAEELDSLLGDGVDVVIDHVGGRLFEQLQTRLNIGARVVSVGRVDSSDVRIDLAAFAGKRAALIGTTWRCQTTPAVAESVAAVAEAVLPAVAAGRVRQVIADEFTLADIDLALRHLATARPPGKVVVACGGAEEGRERDAAAVVSGR